jgi:hypothetical protein
MNLAQKVALYTMPLLAAVAIAGGNKRERVFVVTADTLMTNISANYKVSDQSRSAFDFERAVSGRIQVKVNVKTPDGELIEQSKDQTYKESIESNRSYASNLQFKSDPLKPKIVVGTVTTTRVSDDDSGQPKTEVTTATAEYSVVSGDWADYLANGSRVELVERVSPIDTPYQIEKAIVKAAKEQGATGRLLSWEQTSPTKIVVDGSGKLVTENPGVFRFAFELRIPEKRNESRVNADLFARIAN